MDIITFQLLRGASGGSRLNYFIARSNFATSTSAGANKIKYKESNDTLYITWGQTNELRTSNRVGSLAAFNRKTMSWISSYRASFFSDSDPNASDYIHDLETNIYGSDLITFITNQTRFQNSTIKTCRASDGLVYDANDGNPPPITHKSIGYNQHAGISPSGTKLLSNSNIHFFANGRTSSGLAGYNDVSTAVYSGIFNTTTGSVTYSRLRNAGQLTWQDPEDGGQGEQNFGFSGGDAWRYDGHWVYRVGGNTSGVAYGNGSSIVSSGGSGYPFTGIHCPDHNTTSYYCVQQSGSYGNSFVEVAKFNRPISRSWQKSLGITGGSCRVVSDSSNDVYITFVNSSLVYIVKLNSSGNLVWQRTLTGNTIYAFDVDEDSIYICFNNPSTDGNNQTGALAVLPKDGSGTGSYGATTYAESSSVNISNGNISFSLGSWPSSRNWSIQAESNISDSNISGGLNNSPTVIHKWADNTYSPNTFKL